MSCKLYTVNSFPVVCEMGVAPLIEVKAKPANKEYGYTLVEDWEYKVDHGDDNWTLGKDSGEKLAKDAIVRFHGQGLFLAAGPVPTEGEIQKAKAELEAADRLRVVAGDNNWDNNKKRSTINTDWRRAAQRLGMTREWVDDKYQDRLVPCKFCFTPIDGRASVCSQCGRWVSDAQDPALAAAAAAQPKQAVAR